MVFAMLCDAERHVSVCLPPAVVNIFFFENVYCFLVFLQGKRMMQNKNEQWGGKKNSGQKSNVKSSNGNKNKGNQSREGGGQEEGYCRQSWN